MIISYVVSDSIATKLSKLTLLVIRTKNSLPTFSLTSPRMTSSPKTRAYTTKYEEYKAQGEWENNGTHISI